MLERKIRGRTERIVYTSTLEGRNGEKLFDAADQLGLEDVIGKRAGVKKPRGPSTSQPWLALPAAASAS